MLTLREPIQLKTGLNLAGGCEAFGQRLTANYGLMTARIAPKDLLFLVTTPPEFPEDLGGGSSLELRNAFTDIQQVKVDVVNNVLNRIVLHQDNHFTYQDQVYITSVLRKLGVSDVSHFMEEVRRLREEQQNLTTLTNLYREETTQRALTTLRREEGADRPEGQRGSAAEEHTLVQPRYHLHQNIYHRLQTGKIYQQVTAFHHNFTGLGDTFTNQELRLSEQLRVSRSLQLQELRQNHIYGGAVALHHHVNRYEQGDILPPPETQEQVLSQAAEAALLSTVDHMLTHTVERRMTDRDTWLTVQHSLTQVAEPSLSRFETYHTQHTNRFQEGDSYQSWYRSLEEREIHALRQLRESFYTREQMGQPGGSEARGESALPPYLPPTLTYTQPDQPSQDHREEGPPPEGRTGLTTLELTNLTRQMLGERPQPDTPQPPPGYQPGAPEEGQPGSILRERQEQLIHRESSQTWKELEQQAGEVQPESSELIRQTLRESIVSGEPAKPGTEPAGAGDHLVQQQLYQTLEQMGQPTGREAGEESAPPPYLPPTLTHIQPDQPPQDSQEEGPPPEGRTGLTTLELTSLTRQILGGKPQPDRPQPSPGYQPGAPEEGEAGSILRERREQLVHRESSQTLRELEQQAGAVQPESSELIRQTLRESIRQGEPSEPGPTPAAGEQVTVQRQQLRQQQLYHTSREAVLTLRELAGMERETTLLEQQDVPLTGQSPVQQQIPLPGQVRETLEVLRQERERQSSEHTVIRQMETSPHVPEQAARIHAQPSEPEGEELGFSSGPLQPQADPQQLLEQLREIDRLNRERLERIQTVQPPPVRQVTATPADQARTRADALRALEQPELVLRQLAQAEEGQEQEVSGIPPQVEHLLQQADPLTRRLYETVLRYERNPGEAIAQGLVHAGNVGAFNADMARRQEAAAPELEHVHIPQPPRQEPPTLPRPGEQVLETLREETRRRGGVSHRPGAWEKVPFIFKREDNTSLEEVLQRLEEQRTQRTVQQTAQEEITHQSSSQIQVNDLHQQVVEHTTEDITALINRTMAQQMNQITSQVYRQMERKLQTERSRRGRF